MDIDIFKIIGSLGLLFISFGILTKKENIKIFFIYWEEYYLKFIVYI